jgi:drug/metabolite transporter (DMT)-like permease
MPRYDRTTEALLAAAGIALAIHFATWIASLAYTDIATSTLLVTTAPIWLSLYERFVRHRKLPPRYPAILALAIAGLIAIVGAPGGGGSAPVLGDVLALAGAFAIAAYLEIVRTLNVPSTLGVVARTYPISALVLVPVAWVTHQGPPPLDARLSWFGILAMALVSQGIGHTGMNAATRYFSSRFVATSTLLEPVIAGILATLLFRERLSVIALIGCAAIFIAIALAVRAEGLTSGRS